MLILLTVKTTVTFIFDTHFSKTSTVHSLIYSARKHDLPKNGQEPLNVIIIINLIIVAAGANFYVPSFKAVSLLFLEKKLLTLKAPIMTAADNIHKYFFFVFQRK